MGLLFWSLNDQWQGQSDSAVDYTGRWKLFQHAAARFFAPRMLVLEQHNPNNWTASLSDSDVHVSLANDVSSPISGYLVMSLYGWSNTSFPVKRWTVGNASVSSFSSANITSIPLAQILAGSRGERAFDRRDVFLHADLRGIQGNVLLEATRLLSTPKEASLENPQIEMLWHSGGSEFRVTLTCKRPSPFVFVDPGMLRGHFSDNGFTLIPSMPRTLSYVHGYNESGITLDELLSEVVVRTPWHAQQEDEEFSEVLYA